MGDEDPLLRREFDAWRTQVYEPNFHRLEHSLDALTESVAKLGGIVEKVVAFAERAEKATKNWWARAALVVAIFVPMLTVVVAHFWK